MQILSDPVASVAIETERVTSGWHWRIIENGEEIASSDFPVESQTIAEQEANDWHVRVCELGNGIEPPNCYVPGYGWTVV
jgi:hypothetical protein